MDRGDDRFGAMAARVARECMDDPHTDRKRERQERGYREASADERARELAGSRQGPEKEACPESDAQAGARAKERPFQRADQERGVFGIPADFICEPRRMLFDAADSIDGLSES